MGWNSTVVVMHDSLGIIAQDPEFGKNLASAINSMQLPGTISPPRCSRILVYEWCQI